jgi:hypothetical protein
MSLKQAPNHHNDSWVYQGSKITVNRRDNKRENAREKRKYISDRDELNVHSTNECPLNTHI